MEKLTVAQFAKLSKVELFEVDIASQEIVDVVFPASNRAGFYFANILPKPLFMGCGTKLKNCV